MLARAAFAVFAATAFVYGFACLDVVLRARSAYYEGEKYMAWSRDPALKKEALDRELEVHEGDLRAQRGAGKMTEAELTQRLALLRFDRDERMKESSLKYAFVWYRTAAELFSPPESRWVARSRVKMAQAKELWKAELDAQKVPYKDYMLE